MLLKTAENHSSTLTRPHLKHRHPWLSPPSCLQAVCEVYATQPTLTVAPHVLLSLVLYKLVDPVLEVRQIRVIHMRR